MATPLKIDNTPPMQIRFYLARLVVLFAMGFAPVFICSMASAADIQLDEILVRASSETVPSTTSVSVLTREDLKQKKSLTVAEALRDVVGLDIASSGGPGQPTSIFIRGSKSEHTLVLIDGIEANDPTTTTRFFDFSSLTVENIDRIEIYRGARSTRFGADAVGGVINIITKKGSGAAAGEVAIEAGSYATRKASGAVGGSTGRFSYSAGVSHLIAEGFSSADAGNGDEADGLRRTSVSTRLDWDFTDDTDLALTLRLIDASTKLDASGGAAGDDPNYDSNSQQVLSGLTFRTRALTPKLTSSLGSYFTSTRRQYDNNPDPAHTTNYHETFHSEGMKLESDHRYDFSATSNLNLGLQYRREEGSSNQVYDATTTVLSKHEQSIFGESLIYSAKASGFSLEAGLRHDQVSVTSESILSHSISLGYDLGNRGTSFQANYGTGFKNPSLFQLYSNFGSSTLRSEHAKTWDVSIEQKFAKIAALSLTYFRNDFRDLIDFDMAASKYSNVSSAKTDGAELQLATMPFERTTLRATAKSLTTRDNVTGLELLRRARRSYTASAEYRGERWEVAINYLYVGDRDDMDPVSYSRIRLSSYDVVGAFFKTTIVKDWEAILRLDNLADCTYQDVAGYRMSRRAYYAGLTAHF